MKRPYMYSPATLSNLVRKELVKRMIKSQNYVKYLESVVQKCDICRNIVEIECFWFYDEWEKEKQI